MKILYSVKRVVHLSTALLFIFILTVIYSCRKELKIVPLSAADSVDAARSWYESTYPVNNLLSVNNNLTTLSVNNSNNTAFDYSQHIKPDWNHNARYKRFGKDVIEMPVDPSKVFYYGLKNANTGQLTSAKENSRAWFLLLNDGKNYNAYIMVLIGDPSYINGDPSRLAKNSYRKRDANFSGMVFYFTPKGKFIRSYKYVNGQQVTPVSSVSASTQQTQSTGKKTNQVAYESCEDWYMAYYDKNGNFEWATYLYTICTYVPGDGSGDPGNSGSPSPPPTCQVTNSVTKQAINVVQNPDPDPTDPNDPQPIDPGYPDPDQGSTCGQPSTVQDVKDSLKTPCLDSALQAISTANINNLITTFYRNMELAPASIESVTFDEVSIIKSLRTDGSGITDTLPARTITNAPNTYTVQLNSNFLSQYGNMSREAWGQIITHEILHIFISQTQSAIAANGYDHLYIFKNLINPTRDLLISAFGLTSDDATDLALNGLGDLWQYSDFATLCQSTYGRTQSQINSTFDNYTKNSSGKKCH